MGGRLVSLYFCHNIKFPANIAGRPKYYKKTAKNIKPTYTLLIFSNIINSLYNFDETGLLFA